MREREIERATDEKKSLSLTVICGIACVNGYDKFFACLYIAKAIID